MKKTWRLITRKTCTEEELTAAQGPECGKTVQDGCMNERVPVFSKCKQTT